MRKMLGILLGAALTVSLTAAGPVEAASYTIYGSGEISGFDSWTAFKVRGCDAALAKPVTQGGISGIDSLIVDISGRAGQTLNADWDATARGRSLGRQPHGSLLEWRLSGRAHAHVGADLHSGRLVLPGAAGNAVDGD